MFFKAYEALRRRKAVLLAVFAFAVYASSIPNGFMWDDKGSIMMNNSLVKGNDFQRLVSADYWKNIPASERGRLRPVRTFSFMMDHVLYSEHAWGYHLTNVLLNTAVVVLLYAVISMLSGNSALALFGALFFAAFPGHVESIAWIKNRSDILCGAFFLLALAALADFSGVKSGILILLSLLGAALSKEIAFVFPVMLAVAAYAYFPAEKRNKLLAWSGAAMAMMISIFAFKEIYWKDEIAQAPRLIMDSYMQMRAVVYTLGTYLNILFFPVNLSVERDIDFRLSVFQSVSGGLVLFALAGAALGAVYFYRNRRGVGGEYMPLLKNALVGWLFTAIALIPISNIVFLESRPIAEQRLYIPSIGFSFIAGTAFYACYSYGRHWALKYLPIFIIAVMALSSFGRNFIWKNDFAFWQEAVRANPTHYRANYNLGMMYFGLGDYASAAKHLEISVLDSDKRNSVYYLGVCYDRMGRYPDALTQYSRLLLMSAKPEPDIYNNIGIVYDQLGNYAKAEENFRQALRMDPAYVQARLNLAQLYGRTGKRARGAGEVRLFLEKYAVSADDKREGLKVLKELEGGK